MQNWYDQNILWPWLFSVFSRASKTKYILIWAWGLNLFHFYLNWCAAFQIARRLLGKILIDLRNTREEAISVAELKTNQDQDSKLNTEKEDAEYQSVFNLKSDDVKKSNTSNDMLKVKVKNDDMRRSSTTSDISMDQDDDDDKETKYRLDPKWIYESFYFSSCNFTTYL